MLQLVPESLLESSFALAVQSSLAQTPGWKPDADGKRPIKNVIRDGYWQSRAEHVVSQIQAFKGAEGVL